MGGGYGPTTQAQLPRDDNTRKYGARPFVCNRLAVPPLDSAPLAPVPAAHAPLGTLAAQSPLSPPLCVSHVVRRGFESASGYRTPKEVVVTSSRTCRATAIFYRWLQVVVICALSSTSAMDNWWAYKETPDGEGNISLWVEWTPTYTKEAAIDNQTDFSTQCHRL